MPEPGLDSPEAARFYESGPSFEELSKNLTPEQKHRYTQWRSAQRQAYADAYDSGKLKGMRERGETFPDLLPMFARPGTDENTLFELLSESETDSETEMDFPLGKKYGSAYASKEAAASRMTPIPQKTTPSNGYTDLNSRAVGFSERTFLPAPRSLADAAKRRLEKSRGKSR